METEQRRTNSLVEIHAAASTFQACPTARPLIALRSFGGLSAASERCRATRTFNCDACIHFSDPALATFDRITVFNHSIRPSTNDSTSKIQRCLLFTRHHTFKRCFRCFVHKTRFFTSETLCGTTFDD